MVAVAARGEVAIVLGERTYVLKPEHGRAARLDAALRDGILGTLLDMVDRRVAKLDTLAAIIYYLSTSDPVGNPRPELERIGGRILAAGLMAVSVQCLVALHAIVGGTSPGEAEPVAPSSGVTGSTGEDGSEPPPGS